MARGNGKKIFAYLKNFPALPHLLDVLRQTGSPTIIHIDGVKPGIRRAAHVAHVSLSDQPSRSATGGRGVRPGHSQRHARQHRLDALGRQAHSANPAGAWSRNSMPGRRSAWVRARCVSPDRADALALGLVRHVAIRCLQRRVRDCFAARDAHHCPKEESRRAVADVLGLLPA